MTNVCSVYYFFNNPCLFSFAFASQTTTFRKNSSSQQLGIASDLRVSTSSADAVDPPTNQSKDEMKSPDLILMASLHAISCLIIY